MTLNQTDSKPSITYDILKTYGKENKGKIKGGSDNKRVQKTAQKQSIQGIATRRLGQQEKTYETNTERNKETSKGVGTENKTSEQITKSTGGGRSQGLLELGKIQSFTKVNNEVPKGEKPKVIEHIDNVSTQETKPPELPQPAKPIIDVCQIFMCRRKSDFLLL